MVLTIPPRALFQYPIRRLVVRSHKRLECARLGVQMLVLLCNLAGASAALLLKHQPNFKTIDRSHVTTAIWWPLGVAVVSVTCMRVRSVSHTWKYTQWNIFLFESSDKSPYWINTDHIGFRYETSLNFHTYFGQCPNDTCTLLHIPLHVCPNYRHTGLTTASAPSGHQMAIVVSRMVYRKTLDTYLSPLNLCEILL